jgi:hypothetical protein
MVCGGWHAGYNGGEKRGDRLRGERHRRVISKCVASDGGEVAGASAGCFLRDWEKFTPIPEKVVGSL